MNPAHRFASLKARGTALAVLSEQQGRAGALRASGQPWNLRPRAHGCLPAEHVLVIDLLPLAPKHHEAGTMGCPDPDPKRLVGAANAVETSEPTRATTSRRRVGLPRPRDP